MMKRFFYFIICLLIIVAYGCRSTKKIQKAINTPRKDTVQMIAKATDDPHADSVKFINETLSRIEKNRIDFKTFSAKMKVNYEGSDGKGYDFTAYLRIQKDSVIWISVQTIIGEAFRILITSDSVKMISKFGKTKGLILRSVGYLQEAAGVPFDFKTMQDLLIGNPVYLNSNIVFYRSEDAGISLLSVGDLFKNYITINKNDYTVKHAKLDDLNVMRAWSGDLTYQDYEQHDTVRFSTYRKISIAEKSKLDIEISFKQYNFNEALNFPFPVPKNYKRK